MLLGKFPQRGQGLKDGCLRWLYVVIDLPVCPDNKVSGFWVESLLGYTVLIEVALHLYSLGDTFVLYTGHETL